MKIGVFGGCFNPPTTAHEEISLKLLNNNYLDKIIYVPTGINYPKSELVSNSDRYNMLNLLFKNRKDIIIDDYEFTEEQTYLYQTLDYLKKKYPNDDLYFITGTENLREFNTWKNYRYILENYKLLVNNRFNDNIDEIIKEYSEYKENIVFTNLEFGDISSTIVREKILENSSEEELLVYLNKPVLDYIRANNLYQE